MQPLPLFTFTDFGSSGPYLGQMEERIYRVDQGIRVINLLADAPSFAPIEAGCLLAAVAGRMGPGVFLSVVDPGVGGDRQPVVVRSGEQWFVGPDNGLFATLVSRNPEAEVFSIRYRPAVISSTFHGRDLFAPVAARLACASFVPLERIESLEAEAGSSAEDPGVIIYIDHYGNLMTGLRAEWLDRRRQLLFAGMRIDYADRFESVAPGVAFWYENSLGLAEISINRGSAEQHFSANVGMEVRIR
jgi:S-adenosylmethionine hydrolase